MDDHVCAVILGYILLERRAPYLCEHWFKSEIAGRFIQLPLCSCKIGYLMVTFIC
jgi:hypothetical protein